ncbi:hypothetical protein CORC01_07637 [Colletotrichum orchidophilum]|uniref:Uncharacterized protein n=1 Tax=Colletotrichum orchidophilum TaxID=1209926 RepID=A0A1G4B6G4_9PEZI|nr:uncharacterized protein CORC01_07637 [Colletotrichum orchidophilum]OHE97028.1 hypothetical protein CORC01_07637 [Colletotrichum orchidophilum]
MRTRRAGTNGVYRRRLLETRTTSDGARSGKANQDAISRTSQTNATVSASPQPDRPSMNISGERPSMEQTDGVRLVQYLVGRDPSVMET